MYFHHKMKDMQRLMPAKLRYLQSCTVWNANRDPDTAGSVVMVLLFPELPLLLLA